MTDFTVLPAISNTSRGPTPPQLSSALLILSKGGETRIPTASIRINKKIYTLPVLAKRPDPRKILSVTVPIHKYKDNSSGIRKYYGNEKKNSAHIRNFIGKQKQQSIN
jgi:hypothetical protein